VLYGWLPSLSQCGCPAPSRPCPDGALAPPARRARWRRGSPQLARVVATVVVSITCLPPPAAAADPADQCARLPPTVPRRDSTGSRAGAHCGSTAVTAWVAHGCRPCLNPGTPPRRGPLPAWPGFPPACAPGPLRDSQRIGSFGTGLYTPTVNEWRHPKADLLRWRGYPGIV